MSCQHILISSEQYCLCIYLNRSDLQWNAEVLFVSKGNQTGYKKRNVLDLRNRSMKTEDYLHLTASGWEISLEKGYPLRLVGHVMNFADGRDLLFDVNLKGFGKKDRVQLFSADGNLLIGEEEYLFAPAHSAALIVLNEKNSDETYGFACVLNRKPFCLQLDCSDASHISGLLWSGRNIEAEFIFDRQDGSGQYAAVTGQIDIGRLDTGIQTKKLIPVQACGCVRTKTGQTIKLQDQIGIGF